MKKNIFKQIENKELSPTDVVFYNGIVQANSGLIKLAAAVQKTKENEIEIERER